MEGTTGPELEHIADEDMNQDQLAEELADIAAKNGRWKEAGDTQGLVAHDILHTAPEDIQFDKITDQRRTEADDIAERSARIAEAQGKWDAFTGKEAEAPKPVPDGLILPGNLPGREDESKAA